MATLNEGLQMAARAVDNGLGGETDFGQPLVKEIRSSNYVAGFDGIRAIAVAFVMIAHAGYGYVVPGGFGVTVFFAISGYLITTLLILEFHNTKSIDLKAFYLRRILRLYPELLALIALCAAFSSYLGTHATIWEWLSGPLYYMNYYYVFGAHYPEIESYCWRQLWSLAVEEHFYIFFPALLLFVARTRSARLNLVLGLIILPFLWRYVTYFGLGLPWEYNYVATDARIDSIAWGCLLAILLRSEDGSERNIKTLWFIRPWLPVVGLAIIAFSLVYRDESFRWTWRFTIQGIGIILIIANILFDQRWKKIVYVLELAPMRFIGKISYGIYLYHMLINRILLREFPDMPLPEFVVFSSLVTGAVATFSYYTLETPLKSVRRRLGSHVR